MSGETPQDQNGKPPLPRQGRPLAPRSPRAALEPERVPLPARRSAKARHPVVIAGNALFMLLVLLAVAAGAGLYFGKQHFDAPGPLQQDKVVNIPRGLGSRAIAERLQSEGVIDEPWVFIGGVMVLKARGELKHGEYRFKAHASIADVVETMIEGKVVQHTLTIPEGLTSEQVVARLLDTDALSGPIKQIPREGTLLPDTYKFTRGMTREQMIHRMQRDSKRVLADVWAHRLPDLPLKTPQELVTLASIVEKETGKADERSRVAAVFINRLKRKMRLQSDPTIIYGLTGGKGSLGHPLDEERDRAAQPLQHLSDRRPAAGPDRQSRPRLARSGGQSGAHQGPLFRRRRHRRPRVLGKLPAAPEERGAPAWAGEGRQGQGHRPRAGGRARRCRQRQAGERQAQDEEALAQGREKACPRPDRGGAPLFG